MALFRALKLKERLTVLMTIALVVFSILTMANLRYNLEFSERGGHYIKLVQEKLTVNRSELTDIFGTIKKKIFEG